MSGSEQHNRLALASMDDQATIGWLIDMNLLEMDFAERQTMLERDQDVLWRVVQYTEPASLVQKVWDHPAQMIALQKQITNLQSQ